MRMTEPFAPEGIGAAVKFCATFGPAPTKVVTPSQTTPATDKLRKLDPPPPPLPYVPLVLSPHAPPPQSYSLEQSSRPQRALHPPAAPPRYTSLSQYP
jgi:hypothetical protein